MKPSNIAQQKLHAAVANTGAELLPSHTEQSLQSGDLTGDTTPVEARKRRLDATTKSDPVPAKRARLTSTQQLGVEGEKAEPVDKTTQQEPKRKSLRRPRASSQPVSPATRLRKRQIVSDSDDNDNEHQLKRARLTKKNLALFNRMGKKKTTDSPDESRTTRTTRTTSTTTSGFADKARENGILPPRYSKPPSNLDDIRRRHAAPRDTASAPESVYGRFADRVERAGTEATMIIETSRLLKEYDDRGYGREFYPPFSNLPKDVGFNSDLSAPQPDFVEGLEEEEYRPFPVNKQIPGAVLYQDDPYSLTLPQVAGEWKRRGKDMEKARLQSAYDGAAMVYARSQALTYIGKSDPPGHAEITTFTTDGTNLSMYAHYAIPSEEDKDTLEYHQFQYASTNIKDSYQRHKDGRRGLRNTQDYAKDQSYALRDQLKEYWKQQRSTHHSSPPEPTNPHPTWSCQL